MTVTYDQAAWQFDCEPTMTDSQVLEFCREGYILLQGAVDDGVNEKARAWLDGTLPANPVFVPEGMTTQDLERIRGSHEPSGIFLEEWFLEGVLLQPELAGIMRSLLGANVGLPILASHHATECPQEAQGWHHDADHVFGPELNFVEVFYFPQDTPVELGPTEIAPRTHFGPTRRETDQGGVFADGPAGTLGIHHQSILHRRGLSTATGMRHMLKYNYWRTTPPTRDWLVEADFDFQTADYGGHNQARFAAHMMYWLCGRDDEYHLQGGQAWPWRSPNQIGKPYGYGATIGYRPDWRRTGPDGYSD